MNNHRLLIGAAWLASLALVYFIAGGGEAAKPSAGLAGSGPALGPGGSAESRSEPGEGSRDRTMRRSMDELEEVGGKEKANIPQLIARARLQIGGMGMMNLRGMLRAMAPLADLDPEQLHEALAEVERTVTEPQQRMMLYSVLLSQWAERDGKAALAYAEEKIIRQSPFDMGVKASILSAWAGSDPDAAWAWFQTQSKDSLSDPINGGLTLVTLFSGMAAKDLDSALQRMGTLDESARGVALNGIANLATDTSARGRLLERAATLPEDQRTQIYQTVVSLWAMVDPEETVKWMRSQPADAQKALGSAAGSILMSSKPELGAEILLEQAEEKDRPQTYERIAGQWAFRDAKAAGEWLMQQPQGPELDGARGSYARAVASKDPAAAMEWAQSVQAEDRRASSVEQVYQVWRAKDAPAADAALDVAGLPEEKVKQLKASPVSKTPARGFGGFGF